MREALEGRKGVGLCSRLSVIVFLPVAWRLGKGMGSRPWRFSLWFWYIGIDPSRVEVVFGITVSGSYRRPLGHILYTLKDR